MDFGKRQERFGRFSWTKNDSNYLDIKIKVFKREDKNGEIRLIQTLSLEEADFNQFIRQKKSTRFCSRQFSQRTKFVSSSSIYTVQRHAGAVEACSQGDRRCGLPKQKDFCDTAPIQGGQPRDFLCSSSSIRTEEGGRKISTNCVCQL